MLKKLLQSVSVVLTLALVFSILTCIPFSVSAAETDDLAGTSAISDNPFGELSEGRYTLTNTIYQLTADFAAEGYLYVPSDVEAVIDLDGHTIDRGLTEASATGYVILNEGTLTITDSSDDDSGKITGGYAERGGAVNNSGTLTINGGTLCNNKASKEGGAVMNPSGANLTVNGGVFKNNEALTYGGGAIVNFGTANVSGGNILGNTAAMNGAGIWSGNGATLNLTGGEICGNKPGDTQNGGGLYIKQDSTLNVSGSPVVRDNIKNNLFLDQNAVITVNGMLDDNAQIDIAGTNLPGRALTSGLGSNSASAFTFAHGATAAKVENGEIVPDVISTVSIRDNGYWYLKEDIENAPSGSTIALEYDYNNNIPDASDRYIVIENKEITIDLCGHSINRCRTSSHDDGHVIWVKGSGTLNLKDSYGGGVIKGGYAPNGGAINIDTQATLNLYNVTLSDNKGTNGGAIYVHGNLNINGAVIKNNSASDDGGAICIGNNTKSVSIKNAVFTDNDCSGNDHNHGGAIYQTKNITVPIENTFFSNNLADRGGAIYQNAGTINMTGGAVSGNGVSAAGGGVYAVSGTSLTAEGTVFSGNSTSQYAGGAIDSHGTLTLTDCTVSNNTSAENAGGLYVGEGMATVTGSVFENNTAAHGGGAIYTIGGSNVMMTDCTVKGNRSSGSGGGIYNGGFLTFSDSAISDNASSAWGGGIYLPDNTAATLHMTDSRIENNTCLNNGGGVHISGTAMMDVCGDIVIKNNYLGTGSNAVSDNVRITDAAYIKKAGELTADSKIGFSANYYNHALVTSITKADMAYFTFDDSTVESSGLSKCYLDGEMYVLSNFDDTKYNRTSGEPVKGGALDGATVRFRPHGSRTAVTVNKDGDGGSALHLYFLGHSSRFYLKKVTNDTNASFSDYTTERNIKDAYIIYNFHKERDNQPNFGKPVAAEGSAEKASVHLENSFSINDGARNRFYWYLIPQDDGSYIIQNARYLSRYWSLDDLSNQTENDNKLVVRSAGMKWDIEIISTDQYTNSGNYQGESVPFEKAKVFDSYNVTNYSGSTSLNWMTKLPDEVKLSDLNIPGTHDAATLNVDSYDSMHCQQLYIDDMLNVGVRHLDLRIHSADGTGVSDDFKMVHSDKDCHTRTGALLYFNIVWKWCTAFLDKNPGECLVFQIKEDNDSGGGGLMYKYFKLLASQPNSYIYSGTGMPTLGDLRGKIYIVSRLEQGDAQWGVNHDPKRPDGATYSSDMLYSIDPYYGYTHPTASKEEVSKELAKKWAYDASSYKDYSTTVDPFGDEEVIDHAEYCTTINDTELWVFDDWKNHLFYKKDEISNGLYFHNTKTLDMIRDDAKAAGHDALCLYYTSDSGTWVESFVEGKSNYDIAKEIHSWLFDESWYTDEVYTACFCHNFIDGYSAYRSWASNYKAYPGDWAYDNSSTSRIWEGPGKFVYYTDNGTLLDPVKMTVTKDDPIEGVPEGSVVRAQYAKFKYEPKQVLVDYELLSSGGYFKGHSLSLNGDIGVNFYLYLKQNELAQNPAVSFTLNGEELSTYAIDAERDVKVIDGMTLYKATCDVCAPEMTDTITATLSLGNSEVEIDTYSVKTYADVILSDDYRTKFLSIDGKTEDDYNELATLVTAMLNYGGAAQTQFADQHPDNTKMANEGLDEPVKLTLAQISAIGTQIPDKTAINSELSGTGLTYYGYTMLLHTMTTLRFYFQKENKDTDISGIRLSIGAGNDKVTYAAKNYNDRFAYVEVEGIPAYELNNAYTLSVGEKDFGNYSALTYVKDVLTDEDSSETLINTVTAMYRYHEAAVTYFNNHN